MGSDWFLAVLLVKSKNFNQMGIIQLNSLAKQTQHIRSQTIVGTEENLHNRILPQLNYNTIRNVSVASAPIRWRDRDDCTPPAASPYLEDGNGYLQVKSSSHKSKIWFVN